MRKCLAKSCITAAGNLCASGYSTTAHFASILNLRILEYASVSELDLLSPLLKYCSRDRKIGQSLNCSGISTRRCSTFLPLSTCIETIAKTFDGLKSTIGVGAIEESVTGFSSTVSLSVIVLITKFAPYLFSTVKLAIKDNIVLSCGFIFMSHLLRYILPRVIPMFVAEINQVRGVRMP